MAPSSRSSSSTLLDSFDEVEQKLPPDEKLASLRVKFMSIDEDVREKKVYHMILKAIESYRKQAATTQPRLSDTTQDSDTCTDPNVASELSKILDVSKKKSGLDNVKLFREAIRTWGEQSEPGDTAYIIVQALCLVNPELAFLGTDKKGNTPFLKAAGRGATKAIEVMIEELLNFLKRRSPETYEQDKEAARERYLSRKCEKGKTALLLAVEELKRDVLVLLLTEYPKLAGMESVRAAIQNTADKKKDQDAALKIFKLIIEHLGEAEYASKRVEIWQEAVKASALKVVHYLLKETEPIERAHFVTYENARFVITNGSKDMWNEFDPGDRRKLVQTSNDKDLLHRAVQFRNADIVEEIIREFPDQIAVHIGSEQEPRYPMEFLRKADQSSDSTTTYNRIRNTLLHAMIRSTNQDLGIREIRRILRASDADTICLHLSNVNTEEQSFKEYVQWLQDQDDRTGKIFKFESILKYANFPDLNSETPKHRKDVAASLREDHTEIRVVFEWLRKRGVKQILELSVPDRLFCPHSDADVAFCVVTSAVRVLKWRKLDLYLGNLTDKDDLHELHLYSSGNQSVHEQWYRELQDFPNLRKLHVYVVADVLSETRVKHVKEELQTKLDGINRTLKHRWTTDSPDLKKVPVKEYQWATNTGYKIYRNLTEITNDVVGPNLAAFIKKYKSATTNKKGFIRTKVALIDSGIVLAGGRTKKQAQALLRKSNAHAAELKQPVLEQVDVGENDTNPGRSGMLVQSTDDLADRVVDGMSLVNTGDDEEQVWWHASEPHGTQMARLICSIDPLCDLYVVKVAETRSSGISANVVAEAIHWAINRDVDVISLSLVAYTDTMQMSKAIESANDRNIVILSSTADEGVVATRSVANEEKHRGDVFTIAACDRWGNLLDRSQKEGYGYRFIGHNVHVGQVPFLKSLETINGSSVATAIAAGTASLILACCRISKKCKTDQEDSNMSSWRWRMVKHIFDAMAEGSEKKYIALENLCGKDKKPQNLDFQGTVDTSFPRPGYYT